MSQVVGVAAGKTLEDFVPGETVISPGRTVEAADINLFAGLTGDFYPLHVDEEKAAQTRFGGRIAHGPLTFSVAVGLVGLFDQLGQLFAGQRIVQRREPEWERHAGQLAPALCHPPGQIARPTRDQGSCEQD